MREKERLRLNVAFFEIDRKCHSILVAVGFCRCGSPLKSPYVKSNKDARALQ